MDTLTRRRKGIKTGIKLKPQEALHTQQAEGRRGLDTTPCLFNVGLWGGKPPRRQGTSWVTRLKSLFQLHLLSRRKGQFEVSSDMVPHTHKAMPAVFFLQRITQPFFSSLSEININQPELGSNPYLCDRSIKFHDNY